jgi:hypothetical protein
VRLQIGRAHLSFGELVAATTGTVTLAAAARADWPAVEEVCPSTPSHLYECYPFFVYTQL